jgi:hypothetical protein
VASSGTNRSAIHYAHMYILSKGFHPQSNEDHADFFLKTTINFNLKIVTALLSYTVLGLNLLLILPCALLSFQL